MPLNVSKITPFLWYARQAEEAARFYVSVIPGSSLDGIWTLPADSPSGPAGSVKVVEFTLGGVQFQAMEAGPLDHFNHSVSFLITCDDQAEIDRLWDALGEGGSYEACGWLKDRYGLSWQIAPAVLFEMIKDEDKTRAGRVAKAMMDMVKLDVAVLRDAYNGARAS